VCSVLFGAIEYSFTIDDVNAYVRGHDMLTVDGLPQNFEAHYSNPKASLRLHCKQSGIKNWCGRIIFKRKKGDL